MDKHFTSQRCVGASCIVHAWQTRERSYQAQIQECHKDIKTLFRICHPNVLEVIEGVFQGTHEPLMVMELTHNGSLRDILSNETIDCGEFLTQIVKDIVVGMRFLHTEGIVHGDLKARSILIDASFRAQISNLQTKRVPWAAQRARTELWSAPELITGEALYVDKLTDIYAFGILLFEAFTRQEPYAGQDVRSVMRMVSQGFRPTAPEDCPSKAVNIMEKCWAQRRERRFPKASKRFTHSSKPWTFQASSSIRGGRRLR
mmetsp:Transcript_43260/g.105869  ORF Transcript_43260/g.105869 Transcript_43260/m.105869 type:complete len:259 (+) Transcript_43260:88-864(+)